VKNEFPGKDIYIIVSQFVDGDHYGNGFAYVKNLLIQTVEHECGHCLGLAHAGSYGSDESYNQSGDALSVMSAYPSNCLTSPAYYYLGWTPASEIITINQSTQLPQTFMMKRINDFSTVGISTVIFEAGILLNPTGRDAFLEFPQETTFFGTTPFAALHFRNGTNSGFGGGSAKIKTFSKAYYDSTFTGLNMVIEKLSNATQLVITVSRTAPTTPYGIEEVPNND